MDYCNDGMVQDEMAQDGVIYDRMAHDRDGIPSLTCSRFKTIEEVQRNLGSLGQRKKVFIWFVPSIDIVDNPTRPGILETRIFLFSRHLKTYGFEVKVDISAAVNRTTQASSTDHEMSRAEWIICVCSQSLYDMFCNASDPAEIHSLHTKASLLNRTLYNRLLNDSTLKVIPVILQESDDNLFFVPPTLRDPKNILRIYEETPFNVKNLDGDFERLICRMAGINRMALRFAEDNHQQGFIKLPSKIPLSTEKYIVNGHHNESPTIPNASYQMPPPPMRYNHHQQNSHIQQSTIHQSQLHHNHEQLQSTTTQGQHYHHHHQQNTHSHQSVMHQPPRQHATPKDYNLWIDSTRYNAKPQFEVPQANGHFAKKQRPPVKIRNTLPRHKIPASSPILWELSQEVREWKFLGRYLDLEEEIMEEIDYNTRPNKTRDKALKVLTEWVNISTPTWEILGKALLDFECISLYEKLLELIEKYAVG